MVLSKTLLMLRLFYALQFCFRPPLTAGLHERPTVVAGRQAVNPSLLFVAGTCRLIV
jgi:hypothetical protein